jgi:hypothetical protein
MSQAWLGVEAEAVVVASAVEASLANSAVPTVVVATAAVEDVVLHLTRWLAFSMTLEGVPKNKI